MRPCGPEPIVYCDYLLAKPPESFCVALAAHSMGCEVLRAETFLYAVRLGGTQVNRTVNRLQDSSAPQQLHDGCYQHKQKVQGERGCCGHNQRLYRTAQGPQQKLQDNKNETRTTLLEQMTCSAARMGTIFAYLALHTIGVTSKKRRNGTVGACCSCHR